MKEDRLLPVILILVAFLVLLPSIFEYMPGYFTDIQKELLQVAISLGLISFIMVTLWKSK